MANKVFISKEDFDAIYKRAEEIYCNISILRLFCKEYYDTDDIYKIIPLIDYTYKTSDILYADLINLGN